MSDSQFADAGRSIKEYLEEVGRYLKTILKGMI